MCLTSPFAPLWVTGVSEKGAYIYLWYSGFCGCHIEDTALDNLTLAARGVCVHGYNRTVANKKNN